MVRDAVQRAASSTPEPVPIWKGDDEMILQLTFRASRPGFLAY
jgi:integrase/recombinase XerD